MTVVTFLSDFGRRDPFVGVVHGVVLRYAPDARIVDLTHDVPPWDVRRGALLLARAVPYLPVAVHLAVVDPGVGTARRGVALRTRRGDVLVGPDNGLLLPAADVLGGVTAAVVLDVPAGASATFHARDVFAPAAGSAAAGTPVEQLGQAMPPSDLVRCELPGVRPIGGGLEAEVLWCDRFGNVQLSATAHDLDALGLEPGTAVTVSHRDRRWVVPFVRTFGEAPPGGLALLVDSDGCAALVVDRGRADERLGAVLGDVVELRPAVVD